VRGVGHDTVATVCREGRQLVLRQHPFGVMPAASRDHDQRLIGKVGKKRGLLSPSPRTELVDEAADIAGVATPMRP